MSKKDWREGLDWDVFVRDKYTCRYCGLSIAAFNNRWDQHLLSLPLYLESWEHKKRWYERNGLSSRLITSTSGLDGRLDALQIERIARSRILAARI
jgi:hypothetical protein